MPQTFVQQPAPTQAPQPAAPVSTPQQAQVVVATPAPAPTPEAKPEESILKRTIAAAQAPQPAATNEPPRVAISIDDVKDPVARQILEAKLAEANKGISEAFGKIGSEKSRYMSELDQVRKQLEAETNKRYTVSDVEQLLNRPDFIESAQQLQSRIAPQGVTQEAWSSWTDQEKQAFHRQQQETQSLKQQLEFMQQSQVMAAVDNELKSEYPDYDPAHVNEFYRKSQQNLLTPKQIREAIYWATNGKDLVSRAYELGTKDGKTNFTEKVNGLSPNGGLNVTHTNSNSVDRKPGDRSSSVFSSHAHRVLDMIKSLPKR